MDCIAVNMENFTGNTTSNLVNIVRGVAYYDGEKPDEFEDCNQKAFFKLSIQRPGTFDCCEGRSSQADRGTDQAKENEGGTETTPPVILLTFGLLCTHLGGPCCGARPCSTGPIRTRMRACTW